MPCACGQKSKPYTVVTKRVRAREPLSEEDERKLKKYKKLEKEGEHVVYYKKYTKVCLRGFANCEMEQAMIRGLLR
jgi:hypothetical protein